MTFTSSDNSILITELTSCKFDFIIASPFVLHTTDSSTIHFSGNGTTATPLSAIAKVSTDSRNLITVDSTGLFVNSDYFTTVIRPLKVSTTDGGTSQYLQDKVQAGTNISITKITTIDGEKLVFNNIAGASALVYASSSTLAFAGSGVTGDPFTGSVKISSTSGNILSVNSTGLYVPTPTFSGESTLVATDSSTLAFSTSGTAGHSLTGSVKISNTAGNTLVVSGTGLYVPTPTFTQDTLVATSTPSISFLTSGAYGHSLTGSVVISPDTGNNLAIRANGLYSASAETPITVTPSSSIDIALSGTLGHNLIPNLKISSTPGNTATINTDGLYVANSVAGTLNYVAKFTSASSVGNSLIYDNGTIVVVNGTTGPSKFNVVGTSHFDLTETYSSGNSYGVGISYTPTYSGVLPTSNVSFSSVPIEFHPVINGNTTVAPTTQFGAMLVTNFTSFSSTGTLTTNGSNVSAGIHVGTFDDGTVNGTIVSSAGISVNGISSVNGSSAAITRTNHYGVLVNDITGQFAHGLVTNKYAIYTVGTADLIRFGSLGTGTVQSTGGVLSSSSDGRLKNDGGVFTNALNAVESLPSGHYFNWKPESKMPTDIQQFSLFANEVHAVLGEVFAPTQPSNEGQQSYYGLNDRALLSLAIQAIKELSAKVKVLEAPKQ